MLSVILLTARAYFSSIIWPCGVETSWRISGACAAVCWAAQMENGRRPSPAEPAKPASPLALLRMIDEGFVQVFEKVAPSVVVIEVLRKSEENAVDETRTLDFFLDDDKEGRSKPSTPKPSKDNNSNRMSA